jgi:uncharacterized protein YndB with AHSA1/START domain
MNDATYQINAVRRTVGSRTLEAGAAHTTTISQVYDATVDDVWDACTNPERIPRWFLPVSGELRLGGRYQLEGNAGGTIETCDPPHGFTATWEFGGGISWIEVRITAEPDERTRFELEHIAQVGDDIWAQFGPGAVGVGWDLSVLGLATHLATGEANDAAEFAAWTASPDGVAFVAACSERWADADIAAGTDAASARAAAARTLTAYTEPGAPDPTEG